MELHLACKRSKYKTGFTLIELILVLAILGIIAAFSAHGALLPMSRLSCLLETRVVTLMIQEARAVAQISSRGSVEIRFLESRFDAVRLGGEEVIINSIDRQVGVPIRINGNLTFKNGSGMLQDESAQIKIGSESLGCRESIDINHEGKIL